MPERLRVGVIGLGLIGSLHARILSEAPHAQLVAVSDINENTAREIGDRYFCNHYTDYKRMCDEEVLDAVCICTPDEFHTENAIYAAEKGLHLLIEKPLAKTEAEARKIVRAADSAGVRMMVAQLLHFDPRYVKVKDAIRDGMIGDIIHMF
ncbi:MAG TPA: Gfo/Idh/MocA family oxidoreductase, partial [Anaerovoracaceae bacterium]|nr:Gfo/Idh/MocA family oxidoreductase [Anaerovoracaceae bacterium]